MVTQQSKTILVKFLACFLLFVVAVAWLTASRAAETFSFGVLSQRSAVLTAQYWNPILDYVYRQTGIRLVLNIARSAPESNDAAERGLHDFVYSNTIFHPDMARSNYQVILRPLEESISGQIVTLDDSPIMKLSDLKGTLVGFPSRVAFVGYALPMDHMLHEGIDVIAAFGGNQEGIMGQLKAGRIMAAGVNSQVMKAYAIRENMRYRVLWESRSFHNLPIAVHPRVSKEAVDAVRKAIDGMDRDPEGSAILASVAKLIGQKPPYGFRASDQAEYSDYRNFYKNSLVMDSK